MTSRRSRRSPEIVHQDDVTIVALGPDYENLDESMLDDVRDFMLAAADAADPPKLVVDLSNTTFFGSAFLEVLFRISNRMKARGGQFAICGLHPYCAEVLSVTHLDRLWAIYPDRESAATGLVAL